MNKTIFVGLSGGVDSAVAAYRLKKQGYRVIGVFIKVWHPSFMVCNWERERLDAMRVAAHLDIPFLTCNAEEAYKTKVADYFIGEYIAGRTPNPDILCNKMVKFGVFLDFALSKGADFIATGHYVRKIDGAMHRGVDKEKDQSFFLYSLSQDQLDRSLFPIGNSTKEEIRKEAKMCGLPTAYKNDSQGICFLGHIDIPEFLAHYTDLKSGEVLNKDGEVIGEHKGALVYTLGQRHGFKVTSSNTKRKGHFVIDKNIKNNTITVDTSPPNLQIEQTVRLGDITLREKINEEEIYDIQFRYRQNPFKAKVTTSTDSLIIKPLTKEEKPAVGQSAVIYQDSKCIGGGTLI